MTETTLPTPEGWTISEPTSVWGAQLWICWWCDNAFSNHPESQLVMIDDGEGEGPVPLHPAPCVEEYKRRTRIGELMTSVEGMLAHVDIAGPDSRLGKVSELLALLRAEGTYND